MVETPRQPLIAEIDIKSSPLATFELFKDEPFSFFLDSGMDVGKLGRYSFIGSNPFLVISSRGSEITITEGSKKTTVSGNPFDVVKHYLNIHHLDSGALPVPFGGGAGGYFSYDLGHFIEKLPNHRVDDLKLPECYLGFYDLVLAFDNLEDKTYIISTGFPEQDETARRKKAKQRLQELIQNKAVKISASRKDKYGRWLCESPDIDTAMREYLKGYSGRDKYIKLRTKEKRP